MIDQFVKKHYIRILDKNKRAVSRSRHPAELFNSPNDYNSVKINEYQSYSTEPVYTIEILESELNRLAEFELQVFNQRDVNNTHYNLFETMLRQKELEQKLRDNNEAVRIAYEQYSAILALASKTLT